MIYAVLIFMGGYFGVTMWQVQTWFESTWERLDRIEEALRKKGEP